MMIENQTPYKNGKIKLKFEKNYHYSGNSYLNKVHLKLGFTNLVSRWYPDTMEGKTPDPKKVELIEKYTGGKIGEHRFGSESDYCLPNSFLSEDGTFIGGIREAWFYYKNRLIVNQSNPVGVAIKVKKEFFDMKNPASVQNYMDEFVEGFYGYTHRGGCIFTKGDRIFDEEYIPSPSDYEKSEWSGYLKKYQKAVHDGPEGEIYLISDFIPFKRRGKKTITTWEEAELSATRLSEYLS